MKTGRGDSLQLLQQDKIISDEQKKPVGLKENVASKENREGKKKKNPFPRKGRIYVKDNNMYAWGEGKRTPIYRSWIET